MVRLAPDARYRVSKRGLVLAGGSGDTVLLEHPLAAMLPTLLLDDPHPQELSDRLGPPLQPGVIDELVAMGILADGSVREAPVGATRRFTLSRSGLMIDGIDAPSRWINAHLMPAVLHPAGVTALILVVGCGIAALIGGRPDLPPVSDSPATEALLMIVIGFTVTVAHEFAHAVAIVHYGGVPRRAGFGFYWGAVSFFVDSTPAMTLARRPRVTQALVGLAVDAVAAASFAIASHAVSHPLWGIVFWRLAVLGVVFIALNLAPILQVDGHWAMADLLDEPDLAPRARRALGLTLKRRPAEGDSWLAAYGAFSLAAGATLMAGAVIVFWANTRDLILALLGGNPAEMLIGAYYVAPLALAVLFSTIGLIVQTVFTPQVVSESRP